MESPYLKQERYRQRYLGSLTGKLGVLELKDGTQQLYFIESEAHGEEKFVNAVVLTDIVYDEEGMIDPAGSYEKTKQQVHHQGEDHQKRRKILLADVDLLLDLGSFKNKWTKKK